MCTSGRWHFRSRCQQIRKARGVQIPLELQNPSLFFRGRRGKNYWNKFFFSPSHQKTFLSFFSTTSSLRPFHAAAAFLLVSPVLFPLLSHLSFFSFFFFIPTSWKNRFGKYLVFFNDCRSILLLIYCFAETFNKAILESFYIPFSCFLSFLSLSISLFLPPC